MCLKKNKFKELLDDYPDARKFYMNRAWQRRIEFRRRAKKHERKLQSLKNPKKKGKNGETPGKKKNKKKDSDVSSSSVSGDDDGEKKDKDSDEVSSHNSFNDKSS